MIKKYPDACEHLLDMGGAYLYKQDMDWNNLNLSRCLAECEADCPKKWNQKQLSVRCWNINKHTREKFIKQCIKERFK